MAVIERAFTGGKRKVVVYRGGGVKRSRVRRMMPPPREGERAQSECARLASSTSHTRTPRERSQRNIYVCIYLPLGKSWGAAWDRTLLSPAHIRTQCKNTTWALRTLNHAACACPSAGSFEAGAHDRNYSEWTGSELSSTLDASTVTLGLWMQTSWCQFFGEKSQVVSEGGSRWSLDTQPQSSTRDLSAISARANSFR